ncbi:MAG: hypothetical protein JNM27_19035 [Leptospirales bacterium]|nr:hypothetical protein [Leptospirales bacterium]
MKFLLITSLITSSCMVGGKGTATFNQVRYPISGNTTFLKEDGTKHKSPANVKSLAKLDAHKYYWALVYGLVSLTGEYDLGPDINDAVEKAGGNAVINAKLVNSQCPSNYLVAVLGILPFIPGCSSVSLEGDIVKLEL